MSSSKRIILVLVGLSIALIGMTDAMGKREISSKLNSANKDKEQQQEEFQPATAPRKFSYQVSDHIKGADQNRQESWNNGTVTGSYVAPHRDGKFLKTEYIADKDGFRILKTEELDRAQAMKENAAQDSAKVNIVNDHMEPVSYSVTKEELDKAQKANKDKSKAEGA